MENEYIPREAVIAKKRTFYEIQYGTGSRTLVEVPAVRVSDVEEIPAADVLHAPIGKWKWEFADNGWADHICSECGWRKTTDIHVRLDYNFCPNCGAEMM